VGHPGFPPMGEQYKGQIQGYLHSAANGEAVCRSGRDDVALRELVGYLVGHEEDFGGLDEGGDGVALLDTHLVDALQRDDAFDEVLADAHADLCSDDATDDLFYRATELIAG